MWEYSVNQGFKQKRYGQMLVRKMDDLWWVLNLNFFGMVVLQTRDLRLAIKRAKLK